MGHQIEELARFVARTQWPDIPPPVQHHTKLVLLDTLGVMLAGAQRPEVGEMRKRLAPTAGSGATVYAQGWSQHDPRTAALLNGLGGRSIELCEGLRLVTGQPAMQVLPGALAVAESAKSSGRELLAAFITAYDLSARFNFAFKPRALAHQNGQALLIAAVAAGARLRGLDAAGISLAMRISTTLVMTPSYTNAVAGATTLNVAGGMSGFAAALAPDLALAGFTAQDDAIEEALGNLVGDGFKPDGLTDELGTRWEIMRNYFRLYACCNPIHPALDMVKEAIAALKPRAEDVESIDIATYRFASVMRNAAPPNFFASKYSLPHAAAVMLVRGHAGHSAIDDSAVNDPAIAALRTRVHVTEDPTMSAVAPRLRPARVTLTLKDGRRTTHTCESHRGDFNQPFAESEIRAKFHELAGEVLTSEGCRKVEAAVDRCEGWKSVGELVELMKMHSKN